MRSWLIASGIVRITGYPLTAPTIARPMPVLPLVGSTITEPGFSSPFFLACSIMLSAILSFTLPPGLNISSFAKTSAEFLSTTFTSFTIGVLPIRSKIFALTLVVIGSGPSAHVKNKFHLVAGLDHGRFIIQFLQNVFIDFDRHELRPHAPLRQKLRDRHA